MNFETSHHNREETSPETEMLWGIGLIIFSIFLFTMYWFFAIPFFLLGLYFLYGGLTDKKDKPQTKYNEVEPSFLKQIHKGETKHQDGIDKGISCFKVGEYKEALDWFETEVIKNPQNKKAWLYKGKTLRKLGYEPQEVINCYHEALDVDFEYVPAFIEAADLFISIGEYWRALKCAEKALENKANNAQALKLMNKAKNGLNQ